MTATTTSSITSPIGEVTRAAALPGACFDAPTLAATAAGYGREVLRHFLEQHEVTVGATTDGLLALLASRLEPGSGPDDLRAWWNSAIGNARRCIGGVAGRTEVAATAVRLGLLLAERGVPGRWSSPPLDAELHLGPFLLPAGAAFEVTADVVGRPKVVVRSGRAGSTTRVTADGDRWQLEGEPLPSVLRQATDAIGIWSVRDPSRVWQLRQYRLDDCSPGAVVDTGPRRLAGDVGRALSLLDGSPHDHRRWIAGLVNEIVPFRHTGGMLHSSSDRHRPGCVALTNRSDAQAVLDLVGQLVHESSHQAFYVLRTLGHVVDPAGPQPLLHSAVKGRRRPLEAVLLAFHAFVNISVALRALPADHDLLPPAAVAEARRDADGKVRSMANELAGVSGLTASGAHLLELLRAASAPIVGASARKG